jgi:hypothetical protein
MNAITDVNLLKIYFGGEYRINDKIIIHQPTVGDILEMNEREYWSLIYSLTAISSDFKSELFDRGRDYTQVSDLEMFHMATANMPIDLTRVIFGDLDFSKFHLYRQKDNGLLIMWDEENNIRIDKRIHEIIQGVLCTIHSIKKKPEFPANDIVKRILIDEDRRRKAGKAQKPWRSTLLPLISTMVNSSGFKYDLEGVKGLGLFAFMDSVARITAMNTANILMQGIYSGRVDPKVVSKSSLDYVRDFYSK